MKSLFLYITLLFTSVNTFAEIISLDGRVIDSQTNETLPGALITIPDLKISVVSNASGEFTFSNIPQKGRFLVEVRYIGYKTFIQTVDLANASGVEFALVPSTIEAKEVVITGTAFSSDNRKNSTAVSSVTKDQLVNRPSGNLVDAIAKVPGVSQVTTGGGISKPVIRGLSYNRVVTLVDGAKQEGQQWGDEHGLEVDQYSAERVEVLRGAASLLYGSDALGGVINILEPLPSPEGQVQGEFLTSYQSNNGLSGTSAMVKGNSNGFVWRARGSYKNGFSYNAPGGRIANTGYNETSLSWQVGLNKKWGYAHLNLSSFRNNIGLPDFSRNADGMFEDENGSILSDDDLKNRDLFLPFQDIRHYKVAINSHILFSSGRLRTTLAFQDNQRRELEDNTNDPALFFDLKTYSSDFKYYFNEKNGWEPVLGFSGSVQENQNKAPELLIPDYKSKEFGLFGYAKKSWATTTLNFGGRFDYRNIDGIEMDEDGTPKFSDFSNSFSNVSGALGFTKEFNEHFNFKANLGSAFRSPNIAELSSDGVHEGTFRYEIGNTKLKPENSYYGDLAFEFNNNTVSASLGAFNNYIDNFIFSSQLNNENILVDTETLPVYRFIQANANLTGLEASFTYHPAELLHFENSFSYTRGINRATDSPLPFIPAAMLRNELRLEPEFKGLKSTYFSIALDNAFAQNRVDRFETITSGYSLVNLGLGTTMLLGKQPVRVNLSANNLFDKAYYDHLSRFKPGRLDEAQPSVGYFNQGRNISIGLYLPFK
ncbi:TonB-dependent receptor [Daejeonella lutea]|uniref:Iron complex outermembrane recepter protein n=1 Tax=Daejeonella lutea TaxID=572036 RepID=A0A1T5DL59_9SPHI|nr:TonB-dependent receptor [Daejeonella lutea]SKB72442.1 iron complex outermembrane recepter protein [Daejeonella lutea]